MFSYRGISSLLSSGPARVLRFTPPRWNISIKSQHFPPLYSKQGSKTFQPPPNLSSLSTSSATVQRAISLARASVIHDDPWVLGTLDVPPTALDLVLFDQNTRAPTFVSNLVQLTEDAPHAALDQLARFCDPATFGTSGEGVFNESYRKAGQLDKTQFATLFDINSAGILEKVLPKLLRGPDGMKPVSAELYKLNVHDKGSSFLPHKDTPGSSQMFGSLIVTFPTPYEGGALALRHRGKEAVFDIPNILKQHKGSNKVAYASFLSDVEHEVLPVMEGQCVTLTYNLYYTPAPTNGSTPSLESAAKLKDNLQVLLNDPTFLPEGGIFGFGLNFAYPAYAGMKLDSLLDSLKGCDAVVKLACIELGLPVSMKVLVDNQDADCNHQDDYIGSTPSVLLSSAESLGDRVIDEDFILFLNNHENAQLIHEMNSEPAIIEGAGERWSKEIVWVTPRNSYSSYRDNYIAYGNEAYPGNYYAEVCLVAEFGPHGDRANASAYNGNETCETGKEWWNQP
ncbi:hypothetical protein DL96DRAFT_1736662 [Flagelloscypha sp. PMI_526]|nr:hypothetical protein DL96DRAFT_1736662 [Flagelloscypha sp. PMI_526]